MLFSEITTHSVSPKLNVRFLAIVFLSSDLIALAVVAQTDRRARNNEVTYLHMALAYKVVEVAMAVVAAHSHPISTMQ